MTPVVGGAVVDVVVTDVGKGGGEGGKCSTGILAANMLLSGLGGGGGNISSPVTPTLTVGCEDPPLEIADECTTL